MRTKLDSKGTTSYTYDVLNRLLTVTEPSGRLTTYVFDASGNRSTETVVLGTSTTITTYTYDDQNRLTNTLAKLNNVNKLGIAYTYDNNGNQLVTTKTNYINGVPQTPVVAATNTYDMLNQLISTATNGDTITNTYNGDGLRVEKTVNSDTTRYLYEYQKVVLEQDGLNNQTAWNVYGSNLISRKVGIDTLTYMYNGHADVTALLDTSGNVVATYYYDAFGNILEKTGTADNSILYGGYQYDKETGLYYLNARMYDPITAGFLQKDTYKGQYNDPLSLNLYTYCHNEPLMYSDPTGHREMIAANAEKETEKERKKSFTAMKGPKVIAAENTIKAKNTLKSIGYGIAAVGFVAVGILSAGTAVPLEIALAGGAFAGGVALASTEAYDFFDDGKFNKHDSEYYANFAGAVPVGMTGGLSTTMPLVQATAFNFTSGTFGNATTQYIKKGKIDPGEAAFSGAANAATFALFKYGPKAVDKITDSVKNSLAKSAAKGVVNSEAASVANYAKFKEVLRTTENSNSLVDSLRQKGELPSNYITKTEAGALGWKPSKALGNYAPGKQIGGDVFENTNGVLPEVPGRIWYEADVGLTDIMTRTKQLGTRLLYSSDGQMYVTYDHYQTVNNIGKWK